MKKFFLSIVCALLVFSCFALDYNVAVCPADSNVSQLISDNFKKKTYDSAISENIRNRALYYSSFTTGKALDSAWNKQDWSSIETQLKAFNNLNIEKDSTDDFDVKLVTLSKSLSQETLLECDSDMLDCFCQLNNIDLLIIPTKTQVSGFYLYKLYVYDRYSESLDLVYQFISQSDSGYDSNCLNSLSPYFQNVSFDIKTEEVSEKVEKEVYHNLTIESNVESEVWFEGKLLGTTPLVVEDYTVPSVFRFTSEGYYDKIESVSKQTNTLSVTLLSTATDGISKYNDARDKFYRSFGETLITIGVKALASSLSSQWPDAQKYVDWGTWGLIGVSAGFTVYRLIVYFTSAKYVSP